MSTRYDLVLLKIPVSDIARSAAFYGEALGFEEMFVAPEYGWAQFETGDLGIALYVPGKGGGESPFGRDLDFHLQTADLKSLLATLQAHGVDVGDGIVVGDDKWPNIALSDPDNNKLRIFGPPPAEPDPAAEH